jgi:hypothetical protein
LNEYTDWPLEAKAGRIRFADILKKPIPLSFILEYQIASVFSVHGVGKEIG